MNEHGGARESAIRQLRSKRDFRTHLLVYVAVNTMLVIIWAAGGAGPFWPIWPIAGWGIGLASHAYRVYGGRRPITEGEIQAEIRRQADRQSRHG